MTIPPLDEGVDTMAKVIMKQMVNDVEVKVGDIVAVTNWLTFTYVVVGMPRKNAFTCKNYVEDENGNIVPVGRETITLTKGHKYWKENGYSTVKVKFNPNMDEVAAHNDCIEKSETWMCM